MKARLKIIRIFIIISIILFTNIRWITQNIHAASFSLTASSNTVTVGESVTFTVSGYGLAGRVDFNGAVNGSEWIENNSYSYTVYASQEGFLQVSVSAVLADLNSSEENVYEQTVTVEVIGNSNNNSYDENKPTVNDDGFQINNENIENIKSSISSLKQLNVSEGKLSPSFAEDIFEYELNLSDDIKEITLNAEATDEKATIQGLGIKQLNIGENLFTITVIAEDGSAAEYKITVKVESKKEIIFDYQNKKLKLSTDRDVSLDNEHFEKTKLIIKGEEVTAWENKNKNITLLNLTDEKENNFYIYDKNAQKIKSVYKPVILSGQSVAIIDIPEELKNRDKMVYKEIEVDGHKMFGWRYKDSVFKNYSLIYVLDNEGNTRYYKYERTKNTLQLYDDGVALTEEQYTKEIEFYQERLDGQTGIILTLGISCIVIFIILIAVIYVSSKHENRGYY